MQSVKKLIVVLALTICPGVVLALPTTDLPPAPGLNSSEKKPVMKGEASTNTILSETEKNESSVEKITMQKHIQALVEDDYTFQLEYRKLQAQLEKERILSEIRKLRGEDKIKPASVPMPVQNSTTSNDNEASKEQPLAMPHVVLESVVGGISRVAVLNQHGDQLLYVTPGELFSMNGQQYTLIRDKHVGLQIKVANP